MLALAAAILAAAITSCGGDEDTTEPSAAPPTAEAADFPKPARGESIADLRAELPEESLVMAPSVSVLESGERNRYGFGLYDASQAQITDAQAALYFEPIKGGELEGPFPARYESLAVAPSSRARARPRTPTRPRAYTLRRSRSESPAAIRRSAWR